MKTVIGNSLLIALLITGCATNSSYKNNSIDVVLSTYPVTKSRASISSFGRHSKTIVGSIVPDLNGVEYTLMWTNFTSKKQFKQSFWQCASAIENSQRVINKVGAADTTPLLKTHYTSCLQSQHYKLLKVSEKPLKNIAFKFAIDKNKHGDTINIGGVITVEMKNMSYTEAVEKVRTCKNLADAKKLIIDRNYDTNVDRSFTSSHAFSSIEPYLLDVLDCVNANKTHAIAELKKPNS